MKYFVLAVFVAAFIVVACGCPQTAAPRQATTDKLLDKYKVEGESPKATIMFFRSNMCPPRDIRIREFLKGIENFSEGTVKFIEVNGDADREGKNAYGVRTYPTIFFFDADGKVHSRYGPDLTEETAIKIVTEDLHATQKRPALPGEETPEEGAEEAPAEGDSGEGESGEGE